ncbi:Ribonuclease HI [Novipirellula galeiformis]|uniref:Ribonuclease HI n=1 Tax=Novipirellula galeiformis TaxID=2528004 RepID=A0A5C6CK70_9BACT|nr:ribonuclease HI [Novipirellula galeiformis]TWU23987.1 Ribonuclease HI [Novipirellula galeiformis]
MLQSIDATSPPVVPGTSGDVAQDLSPSGDKVDLPSDNIVSEYLLVCEARSTTLVDGFWQFSLETADGESVLSAYDNEVGDLNRLTLLAAVRGLEAIEGASTVTLISNNRYLIRSLADSLPRWRENNFVWEHFGRRIDVQHADLWRRVDRALQIHRVEACLVSSRLVSPERRRSEVAQDPNAAHIRVDSAHSSVAAPHANKQPNDRLRQWLLGGGASSGSAPARRRIRSADLLES